MSWRLPARRSSVNVSAEIYMNGFRSRTTIATAELDERARARRLQHGIADACAAELDRHADSPSRSSRRRSRSLAVRRCRRDVCSMRGRTTPRSTRCSSRSIPEPPRGCVRSPQIKYVRTVVTQLIYLPLLVRELRRADVVHVFSASYWSFLLAPLPAVIVARLARPAGADELSQRRGAGSSAAIGDRTGDAASVDRTSCRRGSCRSVFAEHGIDARDHPEHHRPRPVSLPTARSACGRGCSRRATSKPLYNVDCTLRAFAAVQARWPDATLTLVGGGSRSRPASSLRLSSACAA